MADQSGASRAHDETPLHQITIRVIDTNSFDELATILVPIFPWSSIAFKVDGHLLHYRLTREGIWQLSPNKEYPPIMNGDQVHKWNDQPKEGIHDGAPVVEERTTVEAAGATIQGTDSGGAG